MLNLEGTGKRGGAIVPLSRRSRRNSQTSAGPLISFLAGRPLWRRPPDSACGERRRRTRARDAAARTAGAEQRTAGAEARTPGAGGAAAALRGVPRCSGAPGRSRKQAGTRERGTHRGALRRNRRCAGILAGVSGILEQMGTAERRGVIL